MITIQLTDAHLLKYFVVSVDKNGFITTVDYFYKDKGLLPVNYENAVHRVDCVQFQANGPSRIFNMHNKSKL